MKKYGYRVTVQYNDYETVIDETSKKYSTSQRAMKAGEKSQTIAIRCLNSKDYKSVTVDLIK